MLCDATGSETLHGKLSDRKVCPQDAVYDRDTIGMALGVSYLTPASMKATVRRRQMERARRDSVAIIGSGSGTRMRSNRSRRN